jgi:uncharacterized protein (TIGR03437 family)
VRASYAFLSLSMLLTCAEASTPRRELLHKLPLRFEENQTPGNPDGTRFTARGSNFVMSLAPDRSLLDWTDPSQKQSKTSHVRTRLLNANPDARMEPEERLPGFSNYFVGSPELWRTDVTGFGRIRHHDVYPGIDLVFHGEEGRLEYDFVIGPHADPSAIRLELSGHRALRIASDGDLIVSTGSGDIRWKKPRIFQDAGATPVSGRFVISRNRTVRFELGNYDHDRMLVIDPVLSYATYLGGSNEDAARGIGRDSAGNIYIAGYTNSSNMPTASAVQPNFGGRTAAVFLPGDGFIAKFSPAGALLYLTYIGGSRDDYITAIAVDAAGDAYVTGATTSLDFPVVNPFQSRFGGASTGVPFSTGDAFVTKVNPTGNKLIYSTYLGGSQDDAGLAIAIDSTGSAYVTGATISGNFPVMGANGGFPFPSGNRGSGGQAIANCQTCTGPFWDPGDAFVTKLDPTGSQLVFSTYLGGGNDDVAWSLALDSSNDVYVAGCTLSSNFPVTKGAAQTHYAGDTTINPTYLGNGFVAEFNPTGSALVYATFVGGTGDNCVTAIAVDSTGAAYVTGSTDATDLPVTTGALQATFGGYASNQIPVTVKQDIGDAFVGKLAPGGATFVYMTYLGGSKNDAGTAIAVDAGGTAYVGGFTNSANFPLAGTPVQGTFGGYSGTHFGLNIQGDAFLALVNPTGTTLLFSTFLGGNYDDGIGGLVLDGTGGVYLAGGTCSPNFPATANAFQPSLANYQTKGFSDAFYAVLTGFPPSPPIITSVTNAFSNSNTIAPNTWVAIKGTGLAVTTRTWETSDFVGNQLPTSIDGVSVTMNGTNVYVEYVSGTQLNVLIPPDMPSGPAQVQVSINGVASQAFPATVNLYSISFFAYSIGGSVVATHLDGSRIGPPDLIAGVPFTPAMPGEEIVVYANGFGPVTPPVVKGSLTQFGNLPSFPPLQIGGVAVNWGFSGAFAGVIFPGLYQFNVVVPPGAPSGDLSIQAVFGNQVTPPATIRVQ